MTALGRMNVLKQNIKISILAVIILGTFVGCFFNILFIYTIPAEMTEDNVESWNVTIHVREKFGNNGNTILIGTAANASDALDQYDLPEPPFPPQLPYLRCWLETPFPVPFNNLLQEYKSSVSLRYVWNLSIVWMPSQDNQTTTTIEISWESVDVTNTHLDSLLLYQNDTLIVDLGERDSYSFSSNSSIHQFQIIGQSASRTVAIEQVELPMLLIPLGIIVLVLLVIIAIFWYKRKK